MKDKNIEETLVAIRKMVQLLLAGIVGEASLAIFVEEESVGQYDELSWQSG